MRLLLLLLLSLMLMTLFYEWFSKCLSNSFPYWLLLPSLKHGVNSHDCLVSTAFFLTQSGVILLTGPFPPLDNRCRGSIAGQIQQEDWSRILWLTDPLENTQSSIRRCYELSEEDRLVFPLLLRNPQAYFSSCIYLIGCANSTPSLSSSRGSDSNWPVAKGSQYCFFTTPTSPDEASNLSLRVFQPVHTWHTRSLAIWVHGELARPAGSLRYDYGLLVETHILTQYTDAQHACGLIIDDLRGTAPAWFCPAARYLSFHQSVCWGVTRFEAL